MVVSETPTTHVEYVCIVADKAHILTSRGAECPHGRIVADLAEPNLVCEGGSDNRILYTYVTLDHFHSPFSLTYTYKVAQGSDTFAPICTHSGELQKTFFSTACRLDNDNRSS